MTDPRPLDEIKADYARFLTTEEVALLSRTGPETVRYWRSTGKGPASFRLPGTRRVLYRREDVEAWLAAAAKSTQAA